MSFNRRGHRRQGSGAPAFDGNIAAKFTSPYQVMQADRGLTYGGTTLATGTTPPVGSLTGSTPFVPVPVWFRCTTAGVVGAGAVFAAYYDGAGVTPAMTGIAPSIGTPVALTGAGSGLSHAWAAGTAALDNIWKATASGNVDQSGSGFHCTQALASAQPIVAYGPDGKLELLYDGVNDFYQSSFNNQANMLVWLVVRQITWGGYRTIVGSGNNLNVRVIFQDGNTVTPNIVAYNGLFVGPAPLTLGDTGRVAAVFNDASSSMKVGSNALVSGADGSTIGGNGRSIGCDRWNATPINFANVAVRAVVHAPAQSYAAADIAAASYWGAAV